MICLLVVYHTPLGQLEGGGVRAVLFAGAYLTAVTPVIANYTNEPLLLILLCVFVCLFVCMCVCVCVCVRL